MKNKINSMSLLILFLMGMISLSFTACSDSDSSSGGQPEITGVKILTSDSINYSYDEYYSKAGPGTMLAIMGNNLGGALHVFINNQELTFNTTMNTDHSLIVTIPTEEKGFKLSAFDDVPDEIRVETGGGTAVFHFKVTAPGPQLQRLQAPYPREKGDEINLFGLNLVDVEKAYFTDITAAALDTTEWKTIGGTHVDITGLNTVVKDHHLGPNNTYITTSQLKFNMPDVPYTEGTLVLECAAGITYIPYYKVPGVPTITNISSDMPQIGEELIIDGSEFVQVESVKYGDVTLTADEFVVNDEENQITIQFAKKPTKGSDVTLTVVTPGGTAKVENFYNYSTILTTFDGDATDNGWGPNASFEDSGTADGIYAHINVPIEYQQWWGTMVFFRKDWSGAPFDLPGYDVIPANASTDEVYLAVEVYNDNSAYNNGSFWGYLRYWLPNATESDKDPVAGVNQYDNGFTWEDYGAGVGSFERPVLADINEEAHVGKWYRHVVPLSKFGKFAGQTYEFVKTDGIHQFRIQSINQSTSSGKIDVKFDNVRVIYIPSK